MGFGLPDREAKAANITASDPDLWKYAKIDSQKAADLSYEVYPSGGCIMKVTFSSLCKSEMSINRRGLTKCNNHREISLASKENRENFL